MFFFIDFFRPGENELHDTKRSRISAEQKAFESLISFFEENNESYFTINDLHTKMSELVSTPYSKKWLKTKFIDHYGESLIISNMDGLNDVLYLRKSANKLLHDFFEEERKLDTGDEKNRILKLAANLIKSDIAEIPYNKGNYFALSSLDESNMTSFVPEFLLLL